MAHVWMSHITHVNGKSCIDVIFAWYDTHVDETYHTFEWEVIYWLGADMIFWRAIHEECHTRLWVMSHVWMGGESRDTIGKPHVCVCHTQTLDQSTYSNTRQDTATHCNALQHTATHCNTPQHIRIASCVSCALVVTRWWQQIRFPTKHMWHDFFTAIIRSRTPAV